MATSDKVLSSVKAKLDAMTNQQKKQTLIFRPPRGQEVSIRIIPYRHGSDPFNELYFHYDIGAIKTIICPHTAGLSGDCPLCDYAKFLLQGEKSDKTVALYKRLRSRMRAYIPVIVRGQEGDGVKFWGVGQNTYKSIGQLFVDAEYGDISDPIKGRDLKVMATGPTPQFIYGQVQVRPAANPSPLSNDSAKAKEIIVNCPNVFDAFQKFTKEEITDALEKFNAEGDSTATSEVAVSDEVDETNTGELNDINEMFKEITKSKN
jgi:hypothetical protein